MDGIILKKKKIILKDCLVKQCRLMILAISLRNERTKKFISNLKIIGLWKFKNNI